MKAAAIIADSVTLLIDALDDLDRLITILSRMKDILLEPGTRPKPQYPSSLSQLLQNPISFWTTCLKFQRPDIGLEIQGFFVYPLVLP